MIRLRTPALVLLTMAWSGPLPADKPRTAGPTDQGFLLPNGWTITPAGKQITVPDLPLNIIPLSDSCHALIATSGYNDHVLALVDLASEKLVSREKAQNSWFGLAVSPEQDKVWWSGGGADLLHRFDVRGDKLSRTSPPEGTVKTRKDPKAPPSRRFRSGLALDCRRQLLYSLDINSGTITAIDLKDGRPGQPHRCGARPYDVAVANNCVAVVDVAEPGRSQVKGFIPTGWYPTAVAVTPDGKSLLVGVGKGNQTHPNPFFADGRTEKKGKKRLAFPYIGTTLSGALAVVGIPDEKQLAEYTALVYRNCPYSDQLLTAAPYPKKTAIPTRVGDPSPIKHIVYIIKENRTYDQVFGDMKEGNGDPSLVMFGEEVSPNHHRLAREFVLLDNLYCNSQVSRDGHPWSTMAYHTDYVARDWHLTYSGRKGVDDDDEGNLTNAPSGYLWDACARHGLSYRSYGEYGRRVSSSDGRLRMEGAVPGLVGHVCPDYGIGKTPTGRLRDTDNVEVFLKEWARFEKEGTLPQFMVMSLGEDHTVGTAPGGHTPQACVASNDLALGRLVEAVSRSKSWPATAIFVIEDDPQNGPDHVDAHRTVGLVISPYTKRHYVDSSQYSTVSMLRTIELILGLPPLSQYDAAARPLFASFTDVPDLTPYKHEVARIDVNAVNPKNAYGAARAARMDFTAYDRVDDFELNEILWRSIKGRDAPLPPAVRRAIADRAFDGVK